jgi:tetratricopeptide (TPR) repeat protein
MRRIIKEITFICVCILTVSCGRNDIDKTLDYVEDIVISKPDSALMLLDSITRNPFKLTNFQRARCIILTLSAKDLTGADISSDTTIIYVIDYLKTAGNSRYLAFAEYYLGRMYQAHGRNEQAMQFYLDAKSNAENSNDNDIKGLIYFYIGQLHYNKLEFDHASKNFKLALEHFNHCRDYKRAIPVITVIGNTFLIQQNKDSAFIYYNKALQLAESHRDSVQMAVVGQNSGAIYWSINMPDTAIKQLYQAMELNPKLSDMIYLNLSCAYEQKNMIDSAKYFAGLSLDLLKAKNNISSLSTNYKLLARLEEQNGNYPGALNYFYKYDEYINQIYTRKDQFNIYETEKKHNLKLLKDSRNKIQFYKIVIVVLSLFILSIVVFLFYYHM